MKKSCFLFCFHLLVCLFLFAGSDTPAILFNKMISHQADSLRELYSKDGYILLKEASMTMESEFEMPSSYRFYGRKLVPVCIHW